MLVGEVADRRRRGAKAVVRRKTAAFADAADEMPAPPMVFSGINERKIMKTTYYLWAAAVSLALVAGCATTPPVTVSQVGPNPNGLTINSEKGGLEVYSRLSQRSDDQNQGSTDPIWYQHTSYAIYNTDGSLVKNVQNAPWHYDKAPARVMLPPGDYLVKARSADYFWVRVPVVVKSGEVTRVHLDDLWSPPADAAKGAVVRMPNGRPIGWSDIAVR